MSNKTKKEPVTTGSLPPKPKKEEENPLKKSNILHQM